MQYDAWPQLHCNRDSGLELVKFMKYLKNYNLNVRLDDWGMNGCIMKGCPGVRMYKKTLTFAIPGYHDP